MEKTDGTVIVVGAGPTGLTLACELARRNISVQIIDKRDTPLETSNALAVHSRTLEAWHDMGIIEDALKAGHILHGMNIYAKHKRILHLTLDSIPSHYPFVLSIPQAITEQILTGKLRTYGIEVERGVTCTDLHQHANNVTLTIMKNKIKEERHAEWVVACDGAHSILREKCGIRFEGEELPEHFIMADIQVKWERTPHEAHSFFSEHGVFAFLPLSSNNFGRIIFDVTHDPKLSKTKNPKLSDFKRLAKERCPFQMTLHQPKWMSAFWIHRRRVNHYRKKNVFFTGDAAHIHSPVGGQGMNTGIQDAYNLAWKLARVIQKRAPESLLGSYEAERMPIAENVLSETTQMTHLLTTQNTAFQWLRNKAISLIGHINSAKQKFAEQLSESNINYCGTPWVSEYLENETRSFKKGPQPGEHARDGNVITLHENKNRLFEILKGTEYQLLLFLGNNIKNKKNIANTINKFISINQWCLANHSGDIQVHVIHTQKNAPIDHNIIESLLHDKNGELHKQYGATKSCLYLIRPDKYIAFRSQPASLSALQDYLKLIS